MNFKCIHTGKMCHYYTCGECMGEIVVDSKTDSLPSGLELTEALVIEPASQIND